MHTLPTCEQLHNDAPHAPHVAGVGPAHAQNDLRRTVVAGGHDVAVVLLLKGGGAKVDDLDGAGGRDERAAAVAGQGQGREGPSAVSGAADCTQAAYASRAQDYSHVSRRSQWPWPGLHLRIQSCVAAAGSPVALSWPIARSQQDVLWLEVSVHQLEVVHVCDSLQQLPRELLHQVNGERSVAVATQEVKQAGAQLLKHLRRGQTSAPAGVSARAFACKMG